MGDDRLIVKLGMGQNRTLVDTLLDTGAAINAMRPETARMLHLKYRVVPPIRALPFDGGYGKDLNKMVECLTHLGHMSDLCKFYIVKG